MQSVTERIRTTRDKLNVEKEHLTRHTKQAGERFVKQSTEASKRFGGFVKRESESWQGYVEEWANLLTAELRHLRTRRGIELRTLSGLENGLDHLVERLRQRIDALQATAPVAGYDDLAAKEAVAFIEGLEPRELQQLRDFEKASKNRATVLRAIDERVTN